MKPQLARKARLGLLPILLLVAVIALTLVAPSVTATPVNAPPFQVTPTVTPQPTESALPTKYSPESVAIVVFILLLLLLLFFLLLWWSNRLDQASYLGTLYEDTIKDIEYKRLTSEFVDKWQKREYHREALQDSDWFERILIPLLPDGLKGEEDRLSRDLLSEYGASSSWESGDGWASSTGTGWGGEKPDPEVVEQEGRRNELKRKWRRQIDVEAKRRYQAELVEPRKTAEKRAKRAISVDLSVLRGRGPEFVLEFTTVVVIIFAAVSLGVLHILDTQQIGTLLAAIAGYVLGRATTRARGGAGEAGATETETRTPPQTSELAELLRAVAGTASTANQPPTASITEPALTGGDYTTDQSSISLAGNATDDYQVIEVQWANSATLKSGIANLGDGTTSRTWRVPTVELKPGLNAISVVAKDNSGNRSQPAVITVKYEPPTAPAPKPSQA